MYIQLSSGEQGPVVSLEEPDDCTRFHVAIHSLSEETVQQALRHEEVGWLGDTDTAWINIDALRRLAHERVGPDWPERLDGMLRYAEHKGWLSDDRTAVSGHCEWH
jgi:hypothetical protein